MKKKTTPVKLLSSKTSLMTKIEIQIRQINLNVFLCGLQISLKISSHRYAREEVGVGACAGCAGLVKSGRRLLFSLDRSF